MSTHRTKLVNGEVWNLPAGASFQILETDRPVDVEFIYSGQRRSSAKEVGRTYYYRPYIDLLDDSGQAFHSVRITAGYGSCSVVVDISDANAGTNSLTGSVKVIDSNRELTASGRAFIRPQAAQAGAGEYTHVLYINEGLRDMDVEFVGFSVDRVTNVYVDKVVNIDLSNPVDYVIAATKAGESKKTGGAVSASNAYRINSTVSDPSYGSHSTVMSYPLTADALIGRDLKQPIIVAPGDGILVRASAPEAFLGVNVEWVEYEN